MGMKADLRNIATIERLAKELLIQCGHYRRNAPNGDDAMRFYILRSDAADIVRVANYGVERRERRLL